MVIIGLFWVCLVGSVISIAFGQETIFAAQIIATGLFAIAATLEDIAKTLKAKTESAELRDLASPAKRE
ncbi:MAG: hypothetical protein ACNJA3_29085 (plasmid) [Pseudomonas rhizophila]|uniref:hypothetical protein n=1 Tax=Pseudomonas rhizophila TaxID=2045200 RepID=UPI003F6C2D59